jgi:hypothetical protein
MNSDSQSSILPEDSLSEIVSVTDVIPASFATLNAQPATRRYTLVTTNNVIVLSDLVRTVVPSPFHEALIYCRNRTNSCLTLTLATSSSRPPMFGRNSTRFVTNEPRCPMFHANDATRCCNTHVPTLEAQPHP